MLGETLHITSQYLINEEKAVMANSKAEALKVEDSHLRKDLIAADEPKIYDRHYMKIVSQPEKTLCIYYAH